MIDLVHLAIKFNHLYCKDIVVSVQTNKSDCPVFVYTLSKKRNATNFAVVIFSVFLIGQRVLGDSFIRHAIDLFGLFFYTERCLLQCVIPEFGVSLG